MARPSEHEQHKRNGRGREPAPPDPADDCSRCGAELDVTCAACDRTNAVEAATERIVGQLEALTDATLSSAHAVRELVALLERFGSARVAPPVEEPYVPHAMVRDIGAIVQGSQPEIAAAARRKVSRARQRKKTQFQKGTEFNRTKLEPDAPPPEPDAVLAELARVGAAAIADGADAGGVGRILLVGQQEQRRSRVEDAVDLLGACSRMFPPDSEDRRLTARLAEALQRGPE